MKKEIKIFNYKALLIGTIAGFLSGLFSSGGGMIIVPGLVYLLKKDEKQARAISICCILPMVLVGTFFYNKENYIDWKTGILCGIGGIIGGGLGSILLQKTKNKYLKIFFVIFLVYSAIVLFNK